MLRVLSLGQSTPPDRILAEAARIAGVEVDVVRDQSVPSAFRLQDFHLVITDEDYIASLGHSSIPSSHLLIMCNGSIGERTAAGLRAGNVDCAQPGDTAAIAAALCRVSRLTSDNTDGSPRIYGASAELEELVRARTRELEESHKRLRLSERMAAMGTLATGIGHDIGNLVLPLRIGLESLEGRRLPKECEPDVQAIRKSIEYLQGLANGLRYLAMDPDDVGIGARHSDLSEWWSDVEPLLRNCLPREVALVRDFSQDLPYISMPLHHLTQIVFNLVQNAGDAMRRQGSGTVCIRATASENRAAIRLQVIDDGPGMASEVRDHCLEPFFTTKHRSVHTGLGLPLVHGLIDKSKGKIELESEPGRGTTWTIELPAKERSDRTSAGVRLTARVELTDTRMRAYVTSVLTSLDFEVNEHSSNSRTAVCVIEPDSAIATLASSLLEEDLHLHIVLFGSNGGPDHPRLHEVGPNPSSITIRTLLRDIRADL